MSGGPGQFVGLDLWAGPFQPHKVKTGVMLNPTRGSLPILILNFQRLLVQAPSGIWLTTCDLALSMFGPDTCPAHSVTGVLLCC